MAVQSGQHPPFNMVDSLYAANVLCSLLGVWNGLSLLIMMLMFCFGTIMLYEYLCTLMSLVLLILTLGCLLLLRVFGFMDLCTM